MTMQSAVSLLLILIALSVIGRRAASLFRGLSRPQTTTGCGRSCGGCGASSQRSLVQIQIADTESVRSASH
ncbi:MAG: hypothetical protein ACK58L_18775 [Planctomycetota bacterium]